MVDRGLGPVRSPQDQKTPKVEEELKRAPSATADGLKVTLDASGRLDIDDDGHQNFHGHSSGFAFLAQIRQKYEELLDPDAASGNPLKNQAELPQIFDSRQSFNIPVALVPPTLPSKAVASELVDSALESVCTLSRVVHRPSFDAMFHRVYDLGPTKHGAEELTFLPLLYAVMAVGCFSSTAKDEKGGNKRAMAAG